MRSSDERGLTPGNRLQTPFAASADGTAVPSDGIDTSGGTVANGSSRRLWLPGLTPVILFIKQPINLVSHPATDSVEAGPRRATGTPSHSTTAPRTGACHTINKLPTGLEPLIQPAIELIITARP